MNESSDIKFDILPLVSNTNQVLFKPLSRFK